MSVSVDGFKSSLAFSQLKVGIDGLSATEKQAMVKQTGAVFEFLVKNAAGAQQAWTLDLKNQAGLTLGSNAKPDITINLSDDTFVDLASGKLNGQKAFMSGKLKVKGNMMLATRLDGVLKLAKSAPKPKPPTSSSTSGFGSDAIFSMIGSRMSSLSSTEKDAFLKKTKAIFQFDIKNAEGVTQIWLLDLKEKGEVTKEAGAKPDITISVKDEDFVALAQGKLNGQKAFMSGKIKVKGAVMLATKLDGVFKDLAPSAKL
ncbi:hypothetical protein BDV3_005228 [Batrachochytrium dendrobatidis]